MKRDRYDLSTHCLYRVDIYKMGAKENCIGVFIVGYLMQAKRGQFSKRALRLRHRLLDWQSVAIGAHADERHEGAFLR